MMQTFPSFLKISEQPIDGLPGAGEKMNPYHPLLGLWLIDMALTGQWIQKPPSGTLRETFCDADYLQLTGLKGVDKLLSKNNYDEDLNDDELRRLSREIARLEADEDENEDEHILILPKAAKRLRHRKSSKVDKALKQLLLQRRSELLLQPPDPNLPLFQNIERAGRLLHLSDAEKAVLAFAACVSCFNLFRDALLANPIRVTNGQFADVLARLTGQPRAELLKALRRNSVLVTAGVVKLDRDEADIETKIQLTRGLRDVILEPLSSDDELGSRQLHAPSVGNLSLGAFAHLARDIELMQTYLQTVLREGVRGCNILLYGPPGCGKTELAKALTTQMGAKLYEIAHSDEDGDSIDGEQRLQNYTFCQHALRGQQNVVLLFDEMEDVLSGNIDPFGLDGESDLPRFLRRGRWNGGNKGGKAWINRTLEENPIPTIWITNNAQIDEAYLRRFDYSLPLKVPPRQVRATIAAYHLERFKPSTDQLSALADLDDLLPAQLERAARIAKLTTQNAPELSWQRVEQSLMRSRELLGQPRVSLKPTLQTAYSLEFLNTNADIGGILQTLKHSPHASFCLYGLPGTGKSLLARYVADELGLPMLHKRASDLLDKYVGETEQRIAAMFQQAQDEGAVLVLDEADSFLCDRQGAHRAWEVTQTNEFLTQLESFEGIFFATTNLIERLDAAMLRRFSHKIRFDALTQSQGWSLFLQEAQRLGIAHDDCSGQQLALQRLDGLTPGDFAAVLKCLKLNPSPLTAEKFRKSLEAEVQMKRHGKGVLGFV
jgi:transitional endoplasmic reticulum ATPase